MSIGVFEMMRACRQAQDEWEQDLEVGSSISRVSTVSPSEAAHLCRRHREATGLRPTVRDVTDAAASCIAEGLMPTESEVLRRMAGLSG